jgi:hypothetical protein
LKCAQIAIELHIILNLVLQLVSDTVFIWKSTFYGRVLKLLACMALVHKAVDKIRVMIFSNPSEKRKEISM